MRDRRARQAGSERQLPDARRSQRPDGGHCAQRNPGGATTVPYPNTNLNPYYYGDLTGLCWVQNLHKVYTAYGGQVHVFNTVDGSEINNAQVTVQGTALDVAYMDALTNQAN